MYCCLGLRAGCRWVFSYCYCCLLDYIVMFGDVLFVVVSDAQPATTAGVGILPTLLLIKPFGASVDLKV